MDIYLPPPDYKLLEGQDQLWFTGVFSACWLEENLTYGRHPTNTCFINQFIKLQSVFDFHAIFLVSVDDIILEPLGKTLLD